MRQKKWDLNHPLLIQRLGFDGFLRNIILFFVLLIMQNQAWAALGGMVVTSQHLATTVGRLILNQGGNAIDAAVAVGYALSVVEPCCGNLGGGGFMLIRLHNGKTRVINFRETAPLQVTKKTFLNAQGVPDPSKIASGYLSVAVPGTVMGLNTALKRYGKFSLKRVMKPAIQLAEQGFILVPGDVKILRESWKKLRVDPSVRAIFGKNGRMLRVGERLVQHDLATSLKKIANGGEAAFYQGDIAKAIVASSQTHGGILSLADFAQYRSEENSPIRCHYRGYEILSAPPPSSGGVVLCEMLNITSHYPLGKLGFHQALGTHYILEGMRYAYRDRNQLGDPRFVDNPIDRLLSAKHAAKIRQQIKPDSVSAIRPFREQSHEKPQTTHYSIVDSEGNAVAVTYTLNGYFGAKIMPKGVGFFLNNEMDDFSLGSGQTNAFGLIQGEKNEIQPGKRPLSSATPTIVLKNKQLAMVLGAPGGSTIPTQVLETLENVIDYHMSLKAAVDAKRYHLQSLPDVVYIEQGVFSAKTMERLKKMGYHFRRGSPFHTPQWGAVAAIMADPKVGHWVGAIDRRRTAGAVS